MPDVNVTVLGTGLMGEPMARNLLKAEFSVSVWNRSIEKAKELEIDGAVVCNSVADAVRDADFVILMVSDGSVSESVLFEQGAAENLKAGACVIDMSSIRPVEAKSHSKKLAELGADYLDAPVSGGTKGAEAGTLAIMVGGNQEVFDRAVPVFEAMGRPVRVGPNGAGQLSKLANQLIVAVSIGVVAEAMLLAEQGGADAAAIRDALKGGFADSTILQQHGARMTERDFVPGGLSRLQLKDINNALEEAKSNGLTLPLAEQVQERFKRLIEELEGSELDHSALYLELRDKNGLAR